MTVSTQVKAQIGSVSSTTMRSEDLIPTFCDVLDEIGTEEDKAEVRRIRTKVSDGIIPDHDDYSDYSTYWETDTAGFDLEDLFDRLDAHAPPFCYFGSYPGDSADYGFWVSEDIDYILRYELLKVDDLGDVTLSQIDEYEYIAVVNDHGNVTLYSTEGFNTDLKEVWSVV